MLFDQSHLPRFFYKSPLLIERNTDYSINRHYSPGLKGIFLERNILLTQERKLPKRYFLKKQRGVGVLNSFSIVSKLLHGIPARSIMEIH